MAHGGMVVGWWDGGTAVDGGMMGWWDGGTAQGRVAIISIVALSYYCRAHHLPLAYVTFAVCCAASNPVTLADR